MKNFRRKTKIKKYVQMPLSVLLGNYSSNAKVIYALILHRAMLSQKNGWEENGNVFVIYPIKQLAKDICKSERSVKTVLKELEEVDLIKRSNQGACKPNHIFVFVPDDGQNDDGEGVDSDPMEGQFPAIPVGRKLPQNKNKYNYNYLIKMKKNENSQKRRTNYEESMYDEGEGI